MGSGGKQADGTGGAQGAPGEYTEAGKRKQKKERESI